MKTPVLAAFLAALASEPAAQVMERPMRDAMRQAPCLVLPMARAAPDYLRSDIAAYLLGLWDGLTDDNIAYPSVHLGAAYWSACKEDPAMTMSEALAAALASVQNRQ